MRRVIPIAILLGIALASAPATLRAHAPTEAHALPATTKAEVRSADGRVTLPFRLVNNHVVMKATVQGVPVDLVLDTGMPMDGVMLYTTPKVSGIKLKYADDMRTQVGGAGSKEHRIEAAMASDLTVDIGDLRLSGARAVVMPPPPGLSLYHDGVIGASLFTHFVVAIDYDAMTLTLSDPARFTPPEASASVPLTLEHNLPYAEVAVLTTDGRRLPAKVVVDLGASHPISLNLGEVAGLDAPAGALRAVVGAGLGGKLTGQVGRVAGIELGGVTLRDVVATFPDKEFQQPGGRTTGGGNLGDGILQRFNLAFDYAHTRLLLAPNKSFSAPFEWDMSGLWLQPDGRGALRIDEVIETSPAGRAGLARGDVLTRVNGRAVSEADLWTLRESMRRPDAPFAVTVTRDGKPVEVTFTTTRMI